MVENNFRDYKIRMLRMFKHEDCITKTEFRKTTTKFSVFKQGEMIVIDFGELRVEFSESLTMVLWTVLREFFDVDKMYAVRLSQNKDCKGPEIDLEGPGPGLEPGSWDPQSQRMTATLPGPVSIYALLYSPADKMNILSIVVNGRQWQYCAFRLNVFLSPYFVWIYKISKISSI